MHRKTYTSMSNITCGLGENGTIIDCGTTAKPVEDIDGYAIPVTGLSKRRKTDNIRRMESLLIFMLSITPILG
jgi:hypothetical protein